ncbi:MULTISPECIES: FixH family protein [unclassified Marinomonas]|uniref:FixH family protein n=1 Tax=unclassified Marinomonas TaxID=196814 RepID=UPI0007AF8CC2|nr:MULTISPECIES: FixH family protein [unclassified Marinomonas]
MKPTPWYKQFWPWFVIAIPVSSMFVAVIQISYALNSPNDMVVDNYYKEGLGINTVLDKRNLATELNIGASIVIDNTTGEVILTSQNAQEETLTLNFFNSAISDKDFTLTLNRIADNQYRGNLKKSISGIWNLYLESAVGWQIGARLNLTDSNYAQFKL